MTDEPGTSPFHSSSGTERMNGLGGARVRFSGWWCQWWWWWRNWQ